VNRDVEMPVPLLTRRQAAEYLAVEVKLLDKWTRLGLPVIQCGRWKRYRKEALDAWLEEHTVIHSSASQVVPSGKSSSGTRRRSARSSGAHKSGTLDSFIKELRQSLRPVRRAQTSD
jgi:hypothetical protein